MLLAAVPAFSRLRRVLPLLPALLLALSLSPPCGAQRASRFKSATRLVFLPSNAYSSKCLDGSPPAYYFRAGAGAGRRKWHVHLPTGGWCFSPGECRNRANSPLGSSRFWATRLPAVIENGGRINNASEEYPQLGGLLSQDSAANPVFHAWNLVWVVYCDGGAYSSTRGRADLGEGASVYMQGRQILDDIITGEEGEGRIRSGEWDLRTRQGMGAASHVLFSGSSAGGHAIIMHCDRLAAAFPRASSKCFADSGFFVDAKDRFGVYSWREYIRLLTALHRIEVPKCPAGSLSLSSVPSQVRDETTGPAASPNSGSSSFSFSPTTPLPPRLFPPLLPLFPPSQEHK
ncbi:unnamed protein product [Closterium sp. NIES-65]|nr:unnamed protein product [Closterium sp. NIES-65]